jgi:arylsulfatase A
MVAKMDANVGRVTATLDRLGLRDNTLIVFISDNGTAAHTLAGVENGELVYEAVISSMGDRKIPGGKATLTDWGTRVPFIASWPGTVPAGQVSSDLVDMSDVMPTLVDVAGGSIPDGVKLDGHSITAQMHNNAAPRGWVFVEYKDKYFVRNQRWKLYNNGFFFDMSVDPDEQQPLRESELSHQAAAARRELQQALAGLDVESRP